MKYVTCFIQLLFFFEAAFEDMLMKAKAGNLDENEESDNVVEIEVINDNVVKIEAVDDVVEIQENNNNVVEVEAIANSLVEIEANANTLVEIEATPNSLVEIEATYERDIDMKISDDDSYMVETEDPNLQRLKDMLMIENLSSL